MTRLIKASSGRRLLNVRLHRIKKQVKEDEEEEEEEEEIAHTLEKGEIPLRPTATSFYANVCGVKLLLEGNRLFGVGVTFSRRKGKKNNKERRMEGKKKGKQASFISAVCFTALAPLIKIFLI